MITVTLQSQVNVPNASGHTYTEKAMKSIVDLLNNQEQYVYKIGLGEPITKTIKGTAKLLESGRISVDIDYFIRGITELEGIGSYDFDYMSNDGKFSIDCPITEMSIEICV